MNGNRKPPFQFPLRHSPFTMNSFPLLFLLFILPVSLAHLLCTVPSCSFRGASTPCYFHGPGMSMLTSCSSWVLLSSTDPDPPCSFSCVASCSKIHDEQFLASDGTHFCSRCALQKKSCDSGFKIRGPLPKDAHKCVGRVDSQHLATCCKKWRLACAKEGEECCTASGLGTKPKCEKGTTCVLSDFGFPELEVPSSGYCRAVAPKQHKCDLQMCMRLGKEELCETDGELTTCGTWGTPDRGNRGPSCRFECESCDYNKEKVYASNGEGYCSLCHLEKASCGSSFDFHGPVAKPKPVLTKTPEPKPQNSSGIPSKCKEPMSYSDAAHCCTSFGVACVSPGEECSTGGGMVPPPACEQGSVCVLYDFGFAALDVPNAGTCREVYSDHQQCSISLCSRLGKEQICIKEGDLATCGAWGKTDRANPGPDCGFACTECLRGDDWVTASNNETFCSTCELQKASCASGFAVYGPLEQKRPTTSPSSEKKGVEVCEGHVSPCNVEVCCHKHGIGCTLVGGSCSTGGGMIPTLPCTSGSVCVITDYGLAASDVPNKGICQEVSPSQPDCSTSMCARFGREQLCTFNTNISTCGTWGTPTRGNTGPDCSFPCKTCMRRSAPIMASDGTRYCSICEMEKASCSSNFRIFGPMEDLWKGGDQDLEESMESSEELEPSLEPEPSMEELIDNMQN